MLLSSSSCTGIKKNILLAVDLVKNEKSHLKGTGYSEVWPVNRKYTDPADYSCKVVPPWNIWGRRYHSFEKEGRENNIGYYKIVCLSSWKRLSPHFLCQCYFSFFCKSVMGPYKDKINTSEQITSSSANEERYLVMKSSSGITKWNYIA